MSQDEFQRLIQFFKALADESRLKIIGVLASRECSVEELAALLGLREPTVSHHLTKLKDAGLVRMTREGTTHLYRLDAEALRAMNKELFTREKMATLASGVPTDAWERKVLDNFVAGERLKEIPASLKKRLVVLRWLANQFAPDTRYPEKEVNAILQRHHPDFATLRRELVDHRLMARDKGIYWRMAESAVATAPEMAGR